MDPNGTLQWNTFLGGSGRDENSRLTVSGDGNVYVTGTSYTATLPATGGTIYVRLWTAINGQTRTTLYNDYTYTNQ